MKLGFSGKTRNPSQLKDEFRYSRGYANLVHVENTVDSMFIRHGEVTYHIDTQSNPRARIGIYVPGKAEGAVYCSSNGDLLLKVGPVGSKYQDRESYFFNDSNVLGDAMEAFKANIDAIRAIQRGKGAGVQGVGPFIKSLFPENME